MIKEFVKKPVKIQAVQWPGYLTNEIKDFCGEYLDSEARDGVGVVGYFLRTLEGHSYILSKNDWIIQGIKGEFYPCKPDVFEKTYSEVQ